MDGTRRVAKPNICAFCFAKADEICGKCKQRWYCSARCQAKDWSLGHKGDCGLQPPQGFCTPVPAPPNNFLPESVARPVLTEPTWRRMVESTEAGLRPGPPRGLRNVGNSCYLNSVLQGVFHGAPLMLAAIKDHKEKSHRAGASGCCHEDNGREDCFRCDLNFAISGCLDIQPMTSSMEGADSPSFLVGDLVRLVDLGRAELNGLKGTVTNPDATDDGRCGVQMMDNTTKAVKPSNLELLARHTDAAGGPKEVVRWLPRLNDNFTMGAQEDAHEFLRSVLRVVEDEEIRELAANLKKAAANAGDQKSLPPLPVNTDLTASPAKVFGGLLVSRCTCTNCWESTFSYEGFLDLSLDITEATDTLEEMFQLFTAPERLDKKNRFKCDKCEKEVRARKQMMLYKAPTCLVVHLKRFRYGTQGKINKPITFRNSLNLGPFLCSGEGVDDAKPPEYELRAVIVHVDKANFSHFGHYVSFVRCKLGESGDDSQWYLLDDDRVVPVSEEHVLRQNAYMLLYSQLKGCRQEQAGGARRRGAAAESRKSSKGPAPSGPSVEQAASGASMMCVGCLEVCGYEDGLCSKCYLEKHGRPPTSSSRQNGESRAAAGPPAGTPVDSEGKGESRSASKSSDQSRPLAGSANGRGGSLPAAAPGPAAAAAGKKAKKLGPNDTCPCGSGKKYKKCHGSAA